MLFYILVQHYQQTNRDMIKMIKKYTTFLAIFLSIFFLYGIHTFSDVSSITPAANVSSNTNINDFWFLASPEWPSMIRPGILGGPKRTLYYADTLWPVAGTENSLFFVDFKYVSPGHTAANEENIGCGYRQIVNDDKLIVGGNFFYDTRRSENNVRHHQVGWGVEALTKWVDTRFNFYLPVSGNKYLGDNISYSFGSSGLLKHASSRYEEPLAGLDYEAGVLIPFLSDYIETRVFCGGYNYFSSMGDNVNGIRGRMEIRPVPFFTIDVQVKDDNYIPTEAYIGGYVSIPLSAIGNIFSKKKPFDDLGENPLGIGGGVRPLRERMTDVVIRDIDIVSQTASTDTVTTTEHDVIYVDSSYGGGGSDGSKEKPYLAVQTGVNNVFGDKWVYVSEGNVNYVEDVVLTDGVTLWGSGYDGGFKGIQASGRPKIDGAGAGRVVELANNNTVMGLQLQNGAQGIRAREQVGVNIHHNIVTNNSRDGIQFRNNGATNMTLNIYNNSITNNNGDAIEITNSGGATLTAYINDNTATGNQQRGLEVDNNNSTFTGTVLNNTFNTSTNNDGVRVRNRGGGTMTLSFNDNVVNGNNGCSIDIDNNNAGSTMTSFTMNNNEIRNSTTDRGLRIRSRNGATSFSGSMSNNTITGHNDQGVEIPTVVGTFTFDIIDNTISNNGREGVKINNGGGTTFTSVIRGNTISNNGREGFEYDCSSGASTLTLRNNTLDSNGSDGTASDANRVGVAIDDNNAGTLNFTMRDNTITNTGKRGVRFETGAGAFNALVQGNTIANNGDDGIEINDGGAQSADYDFGGGTQGSSGNNSIYGNTGFDFDNRTGDAIKAENNWWGQASGPGAGQINNTGGGSTDFTPWLTSDPN